VAEAPTNAKLQAFMRDTLRVLSAAMGVAGDRDRDIDLCIRGTGLPFQPAADFDHLPFKVPSPAGLTQLARRDDAAPQRP